MRGHRIACITAVAAATSVGGAALGQHSSGYEAPTYMGSAAGTIITGQDGFYIPVAGSQNGLVYTYEGNALGLPANPFGRGQFVGVTGGDTALPQPFARAQKDISYGNGAGIWTVSFDIAVTYLGNLPSAQNIGSFSTQTFAAPNPSQQTYIALATWVDPATASAWNASYVWFNSAGTQLQEVVPAAGFGNLLINHWYRWCTTFDLDSNAILSVSITDLSTGETSTYMPEFPADRYMFGGETGSATGPPSGFRYFGGTNTAGAAGNTLAFDNLDVAQGTIPCDAVVQCVGDTNGDSMVNVEDLVNVITQWNTANPTGDVNDDGIVNVEDLVLVVTNWGPC